MKRSNLAQQLVTRLQGAVQDARLHALDESERKAVLRLFHGVAMADSSISAQEQAGLEALAVRVGLSWDDVGALSLEDAVATLAKHPRALKLACLVVADAVFVDGDYDDAEKSFVGSFKERFNLPENPMRDAVEALKKKKLDAALEEWHRSIVS